MLWAKHFFTDAVEHAMRLGLPPLQVVIVKQTETAANDGISEALWLEYTNRNLGAFFTAQNLEVDEQAISEAISEVRKQGLWPW